MENTFLKIIVIVTHAIQYSLCTVDGLSYMDPLDFRPLPDIPGSDPCNPLYWYPRNIPEYCDIKKNTPMPEPAQDPGPLPMPIPVPVPQPVPLPVPVPLPPAPPYVHPVLPPLPAAPFPPVPLPYGIPIAPSNPMMPFAGIPQIPPMYSSYPHMPQSYPNPYPFPRQQVGMVPGIPGLVSEDGGINVLPFSDAYSDMLEKHKNKMLRKRLRKVIRDYDDFPRISFRRHNMHRKRNYE